MTDQNDLATPGIDSPKKYCCPVNGVQYGSVGYKTVLRHVFKPWERNLKDQAYYFCTDPDCDVVYFGLDNTLISRSEIRTEIGIKGRGADRTICYCFGVAYSDAVNDSQVVEFVKEKTKQSLCSCTTSNPSGRCCLKDFPRQ